MGPTGITFLSNAVITDGVTTVPGAVELYFTSGAVITDLGNGIVGIAISGSSSGVSSLNGLTGAITLAAGSNISISPTGNTLTISASFSAPVSSVSNSDGTLTISPTTGAVVASLNLAHANTWTGQQIFSTVAPSSPYTGVTGSEVWGQGATTVGSYDIVLGNGATDNSIGYSVLIGYQSNIDSSSFASVVLGYQAFATSGGLSVAIGYQAGCSVEYGVALGIGARVNGDNGVAIGSYAVCNVTNGVVIGNGNTLSATIGLAGPVLGVGNTVSGNNTYSLTLGSFNTINGFVNAVLVGGELIATRDHEFVIGSGSDYGAGRSNLGVRIRGVGQDTNGSIQDAGVLDFVWLSNTAGSQQGRINLTPSDYNGVNPVVVSAASNGSAGLLSFYGATPVVQQSGNVLTALANYGLGTLTAGGVDTIEFVIDGGGSVITVGAKKSLEIGFACTINRVTMLADQPGTIGITINKSSYSGFPTTTSIVASSPPTLTSAQKSQDSTLTG